MAISQKRNLQKSGLENYIGNALYQHYLLINIHHIACDGWSVDILLQEIDALYHDQSLPVLSFQYQDFVFWEKNYLKSSDFESHTQYWLRKLQGFKPLVLPTDQKRPKNLSYQGQSLRFCLDVSLSNQLKKLAIDQKCSLYTILFTGFYILMSKYSQQSDVVIGTPMANREHKDTKDLIGLFTNILPVRQVINYEHDVLTIIPQLQATLIELNQYQSMPFEKIIALLSVAQDTSRHPLFQVIFSMQSFGVNKHSLLQPQVIDDLHPVAKFDLSCVLDDSQDAIQGILNYATSLYKKTTIERMVQHYILIFEQMVVQKSIPIKNYTLLSTLEYQKIVYDWNKTDKPYPKDKTIHALFEAQVIKTPNNVAIVFEDQQLTYRQLNINANQLARYLCLQTNIKPDTLIALFIDKSLEMIIGILGIHKSGAAYVPIDPEYPKERIQYILEDTKTKQILTQSRFITKLSNLTDISLIPLDTDCYKKQEINNLPIKSKSTDLAYVIYTSGTTGKPKGVMIENRNFLQLLYSCNFSKSYKNKVLWTTFVFDVSVYEIFSPILNGGKLFIVPNEIRVDCQKYFNFLNINNIDTAYIPPFFISHFANYLHEGNRLKVEQILTGVHKLYSQDSNNIVASGITILNAYGPTESTVCSTSYLQKKQCNSYVVPIGAPLENEKVYVLDQNNEPVPVGIMGELYIAGAGLARGYLNQPKLTKERFINNPFASQEDIAKGYTRLYKTGDLCRYLPDGNIEYIGRNDFQVKVRGYRVELGEIEQALLSINNIQQAVVLAKDKGKDIQESKYLIGYFVTKNNIELNKDIILSKLAQKLPEYMVPNILVQLEKLPLTINGKLDRDTLPEARFISQHYIPPSNAKEELVCKAFSNILAIEKISVDDDFFKLGGNSITAIRLSMLLQQNFNIYLSEIFDLRTPQNIAKNRAIIPGALKARLLKLKETIKSTGAIDLHTQEKIKKYQQSVQQIKSQAFSLKPIKNVLLTGGAGFLGCNLLNQLLQLTPYTIYLLIRANNKQAVIERMEHKFQFYFEQSLIKHYASRVVFVPCDLEKPYLGLSEPEYQALALKIDSVIHAAALTKHYGDADKLRSANVDATVNLLKFTQLTQLKDFHYISTYSVSEVIRQGSDEQYVFTEDDHPEHSGEWTTIYNQTKYLGEQHTRNFRTQGINTTNIYRVGNLACMQNGKLQEDAEDNAFLNYLQFLTKLKCIPENMDKVEISPVDLTAEAIVKMFDKVELINNTYHVFNPNLVKLSSFLKINESTILKLAFSEFIDRLISYLDKNRDYEFVARFLLRIDLQENFNNIIIWQDKTESTLRMLNFEWPLVESSLLSDYNLQLNSKGKLCM